MIYITENGLLYILPYALIIHCSWIYKPTEEKYKYSRTSMIAHMTLAYLFFLVLDFSLSICRSCRGK